MSKLPDASSKLTFIVAVAAGGAKVLVAGSYNSVEARIPLSGGPLPPAIMIFPVLGPDTSVIAAAREVPTFIVAVADANVLVTGLYNSVEVSSSTVLLPPI